MNCKSIFTIFTFFAIVNGISAIRPRVTVSTTECEVCTYITGLAENYIGMNATEYHIKEIIERACGFLPHRLMRACPFIVDKYLPEIINSLEKEFPPSVICSDLQLCSTSRFFRRVINQSTSYTRFSGRNTTSECASCEAAVASIESEALNFINSSEWNRFIKFCQDMPERRVQACFDLLSVIPLVINGFVGKYPPETFCADILLC